MAESSTADIIVKFGADMTQLKAAMKEAQLEGAGIGKGFKEAGTEASSLDGKVKTLGTTTSGVKVGNIGSGFKEAGSEANSLETKVKSLGTSTAGISSVPVSKLKTDLKEAGTVTAPVVTGLKDTKGALSDIKAVSAFESHSTSAGTLKGVLTSTSKEARGLNTVMKSFGGDSSPILKEVAGVTRLGAAFTADAGGAGILGTVMGTFGPILLPVVAIIAAITGGFMLLYATSQTFQGVIGTVISGFKQIFGWISNIASALMAGDFGKAGDLLKKGFEGAFNVLKNFDYGSIGATIVKIFSESFTSIKNTLTGVWNVLKSIDWGAVGAAILSGLKSLFDMGAKIRQSLMAIDWGGLFAGALDAVSGFLDKLLSFDPAPMIDQLINAIGKAFDSLFGGGGKGDVGTHVTKGVEKAGPDILGKLITVFEKLVALLPTIFLKISTALFNALSKVDWGTVFNKMLEFAKTAFGKIGDFIKTALGGVGGGGIDWGGIVKGLFVALAGAAVGIGTALLNALKAVNWAQIFTMIFVTLKFFGTAILNAFKAIDWGGAFDKIKAILGPILKEAFDLAITAVKTGLGMAVSGAVSLLTSGWNTAVNTVKTLLGGAVSSAVSLLTSGWSTAVNTVKTLLGGAVSSAVSLLTSGWTTIVNTVKSVLGSAVSTAVSTLTSGWTTIVNTVKSVLGSAASTAVSTLTSGWTTIVNTVKSVLGSAVSTAVSGLTSGWTTIVNTVKSVLGTAVSTAVSSLTSGWTSAVNTVKSTLGTAVSSAVSSIQSGFNTAVNTIKTGLSGAVSTLSSGIQTAASNFGTWIKNAVSGFGTYLSNLVNGADIGNRILQGIQGISGGVAAALGSAAGSFVQYIKDAWNNSVFGKIYKFAEGAVVGSPTLAIIGEAGEREAVIPEHLWGGVAPSVLNQLPQYGAGAIVGGGAAMGNFSSTPLYANLPGGRAGGAGEGTSISETNVYNAYINVDSENIKREMFKLFDELEKFHRIGR